jgi:hypothetical protein
MVLVRPHGDNRGEDPHDPSPRFVKPPDAAGHGRFDLTLRLRAKLP